VIKIIKLSNGKEIKYNTKTYEGYDEILEFYEPKISTLVYNWKHAGKNLIKGNEINDSDDLAQICRIKILDALEKFDTKKNISFSTYLYTAWHRKLFQVTSKYKAKKYSSFVQDDNFIHFGKVLDKDKRNYCLTINEEKCPINGKLVNGRLCGKCEHFCGKRTRTINKGCEKGKKEKMISCKYCSEILNKRGLKSVSINSSENDNTMNAIDKIGCNKQERLKYNNEFNIDLNRLKDNIGELEYKIIELLLNDFSKTKIIEDMELSKSVTAEIFNNIENNKILKEILSKEK
jgi:RNA polymerase sigma factor (sigma-70 family)